MLSKRIDTGRMVGAFLVAAPICFGLPATALAELAGSTTGVETQATAAGPGGNRTLATGQDLFDGDRVRTDATGLVHIEFLDETRMVVGPNSELTIDDFVYQSDQTARSLTINATRGAFRFLSGRSDKTAYRIETPLATIGVRGTAGDITVNDDGSASFSIWNGAFQICTSVERPRRCVILEDSCGVITLDANLEYDWIRNLSERSAWMDQFHPFAFNEGGLQRPYRVGSGSCNQSAGGRFVPELDPADGFRFDPPEDEDEEDSDFEDECNDDVGC